MFKHHFDFGKLTGYINQEHFELFHKVANSDQCYKFIDEILDFLQNVFVNV